MKIMIVDNDPTYLSLLAEVLQLHGHQVVTATNGEEALLRLWQESVDFVLSDISMPKMNGMNLHRYIRRDPVLKHLPFAWNSGYRELRDIVDVEDPAIDLNLDKTMPVSDLLLFLEHAGPQRQSQIQSPAIPVSHGAQAQH